MRIGLVASLVGTLAAGCAESSVAARGDGAQRNDGGAVRIPRDDHDPADAASSDAIGPGAADADAMRPGPARTDAAIEGSDRGDASMPIGNGTGGGDASMPIGTDGGDDEYVWPDAGPQGLPRWAGTASPDGTCARLGRPPAPGHEVLQLQEGYPIAPHVMALENGFALFTHELIIGGQGRAPFSRFDSADGLAFAQRRDFEGTSSLGVPEDVIVVDDRWYWFYVTPEDLAMGGAGTRNEIAWLTSDDGQVWQAGGRYQGSGRTEDGQLMTAPRVVHDGQRFHLYYTGWNRVVHGDVATFSYSVMHAMSDDGDGFAFESVLFAAEPCEVSSHSTWTLTDVLSSPCLADCPIDAVHLVMRHRACPTDATSTADAGYYVASSTDGAHFSTPVRVPELMVSDTVMVDGRRLISWAHDSSAFSVRVNVQPLPAVLAHVCGKPTAP